MWSLHTIRRSHLAALSACVAFFSAASHAATPVPIVVPDGVANCVWIKLQAKGSGYERMADDAGLGPKRTINASCYMQLVYMEPDAKHPHGRYGAPILCPIDAEHWAASVMDDSFTGTALADGNVIAPDTYLTFTNAGSDVVQGYGTHRILITIDKKTLAFKKAIFQSLGAEMIDNSTYFLTPDSLVVGSYSAKGTSVLSDNVPPEAKALVAGGPCP